MVKMPRGLLAATLVALALTGCAMPPSGVDRLREDPSRLLQQAQQQGPQAAAQSRLEAADILARQGERTQALEVARDLDDTSLPPQERARWAMLLSSLGETLDAPWAVIRAGQEIDALALTPNQTHTLRERMGRALLAVDEPLAAAKSLLRVQDATGRPALNDIIWKAVSRLDRGQLTTLDQVASPPLARGWAELARLSRASGADIERLLDQLDDWRQRHPEHPAAHRLPAELLALRDLRGQEVKHIAVFLPESGPLAAIADAIGEGMRTRHLHAANQGSSARLSFLDSSGGDLESLYREAQHRGAQVVVGPLDKALVSMLEQRARVPLPTLALNYGNAERNRAEALFQYGLSAEDEARQVARRAWRDSHRQAALLVPDNAWGGRVGEAFRDAWRQRGGTLTRAVSYDPQGSVAEAVRPALNVSDEHAQLEDIDLLFLLALPEYARQVPPTLDYYYASELPIYATSHLYDGRAQPRLNRDLDGVQFLDIPWQIPNAAVGGEDALPFVASYRELREESEPTLFRLKAMGVDAYELARRLPRLRAVPGSELFGATGTLRPDQDGRIRRQLPWARFENGIPQPILKPWPLERQDDAIRDPADADSDVRDDAS